MTDEEREAKEQRIRDLKADLGADVSAIGDWKHIKYVEYQMQGKAAPYTDEEMQEYYDARQAARDEINELAKELEV